jgi:uncharacterized protein with GYD domain
MAESPAVPTAGLRTEIDPSIFGENLPECSMATFILLSTLTDEGAKTVKSNPERIKEVNRELEQLGATVKAQYATLGPYDFVNIVEARDNSTILRVSAELASRGSVKLLTLAAIPVDEFVKSLK